MGTSVYFIRPIGMKGPVKIGCSYSPEDRMGTLMTWSPFPLEVAASLPGDGRLERRVHGKFAHLHSHREWFREGDDLTAFVAAVASGVPIEDLIDFSIPPHDLRKKSRGHFSPSRRKYLSYRHRLDWARRRQGDNPRQHYPADVYRIIDEWWRSGPRTDWEPSAEQLRRLDEVLANFPAHAVTWDERFPEEEAA